MDTIDPNDHAAWAAVDKYLEAQPLNYQDLDIDWSTAQYVDGQLQVNAIVGLAVPEHVLRKPQEYMDELKELRGRVLALSKENHQLKANLAEKSAEVMKFAGDVVKLEETVKNKDRAIEVLKETHGSLITEIAAQRDELQRKLDIANDAIKDLEKDRDTLKDKLSSEMLRNAAKYGALEEIQRLANDFIIQE